MDGYHGTATLEWWANPLSCLGSYRVSLTVTVAGGDWRGVAVPDSGRSERAREGFDFLMLVDPVFTLRFPDDSTLLVDVVAEGGHLVLSASGGPVTSG
ncbi:hypothetical protein [Kitasatospora sp. P5_F3]